MKNTNLFRISLAAVSLLVACSNEVAKVDAPKATGQTAQPLYLNTDFELTPDLVNWTVTSGQRGLVAGFLDAGSNPDGGILNPIRDQGDLALTIPAGVNRTTVRTGPVGTLIPPGLVAADSLRMPRYGSKVAVVNDTLADGSSTNANILSQSSIVTAADIDPVDGLVHTRIVIAPIASDGAHAPNSQPFYFAQVKNLTQNKILLSRFAFANQPGVPWKSSTAAATTKYLDWSLIDSASTPAEAKVGDNIEVRVIAARCEPSGHFAHVLVDTIAAFVPGISVTGDGPIVAAQGSNYGYEYIIRNGSSAVSTSPIVTIVLPAQTTFVAVNTPGVMCTTPAVGAVGTIVCTLANIPVGGNFKLNITVKADPTATGTINHGNYNVRSTEEQPLIGPLVTTIVAPDADGDGLSDADEIAIGSNPNDKDSDDDGINDGDEIGYNTDSDGDGLINVLDPDSDNDGLKDGTERGVVTPPSTDTDITKGNFVADADPTTRTNPILVDTDFGGISDGREDINKNGKIDPGETNPLVGADDIAQGVDTDGDGLTDAEEMAIGTSPNDKDTDDDGVNDGAEDNYNGDTDGDGIINAKDPDSDNDGLKDGTERGVAVPPSADTVVANGNFIPDLDPATKTSMVIADTDNGGLSDGAEDTNKNGRVDPGELNPLNASDDANLDSDGDGVPNRIDLDDDNDGILDTDEGRCSAAGAPLVNYSAIAVAAGANISGTTLGTAIPGLSATHAVTGAVDKAQVYLGVFPGGPFVFGNEYYHSNIVDPVVGGVRVSAVTTTFNKPVSKVQYVMSDLESYGGPGTSNERTKITGFLGATPVALTKVLGSLITTVGGYELSTANISSDESDVRLRVTYSFAGPVDRIVAEYNTTSPSGGVIGFVSSGCSDVDTDGDGVVDSLDLDADNDGILDLTESGRTSGVDANGDGRLDGNVGTDGVPDSVQAMPNGGTVNYTIIDTDGDGKPDFRDLDSDNDGINDVREANGTDANGDGLADGVTNSSGVPASVPAAGLNPPDTDGDARPDFRDLDSDNDGINDVVENGGIALDPDNNGIVGTGAVPADADGDGIADVADSKVGFGDATDPVPLNSDNDAVPNYRDLDSDNDSIADVIEGGNGIRDINGDGTVSISESPDADRDGIVDSLDNAPAAFGDAGNGALPEQGGADTDTIPDYLDLDSDGDGTTDLVEEGRNPAVLDANGDGQIDAPVDPDGDGIPNNAGNDSLPAAFGGSNRPDVDNDGILNSADLDDDNDGILDSVEGTVDTDGDGVIDAFDLDSDNDGILDITESGQTTGADANGDGRLDGAVGSDGVPDSVQAAVPVSGVVNYTVIDTDGDGKPDFRDLDSDNDGINDVREANGTDANADGLADGTVNAAGVRSSVPAAGLVPPNTDGDSRPDYRDLDSDNDGINDVVENGGIALDPDNNGIVGTGAIPMDTDNDGIANVADGAPGFGDATDPALANGDNDLVPNFRDLDSDNDTVADVIEGGNGGADTNKDGTVSLTESPDGDGDGIVNALDNAVAAFGDAGNGAIPEQGGADTDTIPDFLDLDSDQDGLTDLVEAGRTNVAALDPNGDGQIDAPADPDGDGIPNNNGNDSIPAGFGGSIAPIMVVDSDNDGVPDTADFDDDNDGILDSVEGTVDTDGDGIIDALDLDSDNDGLLDITESGRTGGIDANNDGRLDGPVGTDGVPDSVQAAVPVSGVVNYTIVDTDGDLRPDFRDLDSDNDGLSDVKESNGTDANGDGKADGAPNAAGVPSSAVTAARVGLATVDTDGDSKPDFRDLDSDNDGINDVREANGTDANGDGLADGAVNANGVPASVPAAGLPTVDTDSDGKPDYRDLDSDNDGINDVVENGGLAADPDNNGIVGTGAIPMDTDGDGIANVVDGAPAAFGDATDPALANGDNDSVPNFRDLDSDNDSIADVIEGGNGAADVNGDGTVSVTESPDADGDGIVNSLDNAPAAFGDAGNAAIPEQGGADTDMVPDYLDLDSDGDAITDLVEAGRDPAILDASGDGQIDAPTDPDGDGIPNNAGNDTLPAVFGGSRVPDTVDSDMDGIFDGADLDDDNDGIPDSVEGQSTDTDGDGVVDRLDLDTDNDGILDVLESGRTGGADANGDGRLDGPVGTDGIPDSVQAMPNNGVVNYTVVDTDGDMKPDWRDLDSDNDGINDVLEANGTDANGDGKADGTTNVNGINMSVVLPAVAPVDTDGDGAPDFRDLDSDNDGINDVVENGGVDPDNNGIVGTGANPTDTDGDGIADVADGAPMAFGDAMGVAPLNSDNDTVPNYRDLDSDNDSIADVIEGGNGAADTDKDGTISVAEGMGDADKDGIPDVLDNAPMVYGDAGNAALPEQGGSDTDMIPDYLDLDSNGDGVSDLLGAQGDLLLDANSDGQIDMPVDADKDGIPDNLGNDSKPGVFGGTSVPKTLVDTDMDGIPDAVELMLGLNPMDADSDDDGVIDGAEPQFGTDTDGDGLINALDPDSDNDGLFDGTELGITMAGPDTDVTKKNFVADADPATKTNPLDPDTDKGGVTDGNEDTNHNGKIDAGETDPNLMSDDGTLVDTDGDGLSDAVEALLGTNPMDKDSDDDGVNDGAEPNFANDTDGDGKINALDADSDADGLFDGTELGVVTPPSADTDLTKNNFIADADPTTKTNPLLKDTDKGTVSDGDEDKNHNGKVDPGERDPNLKSDDNMPPNIDTDGDGIPDYVEGTGDADGDGIPNYLDLDSDGDGIPDSVEAGDADLNTPPVDTDGDGTPDYLDLDSDNDGLTDAIEGNVDTDGDGVADFRDTDSDNDGVKDATDNCRSVSNSNQADADKDAIGDACDPDKNGDGILDAYGLSGGSGRGCAAVPVPSVMMLLLALSAMRKRKQ
jgi:large repetitive protein